MTSNIIIIYTSKIEYLLVLCVYIDIKMIFSHIIEEKNNIKIGILEEAKFMNEHDFQMVSTGSHVTSCFWWFVQALKFSTNTLNISKNVLASVSLCCFSSGKHIIIEVPFFINVVAGDRNVSLSG